MSRAKLLSVIALFAASIASALAQNAQTHSVQQELIDTDRALWQAIAGPRPDSAQLSAGLAPDYIDIDQAVVHPRVEVIKNLKDLKSFSFQYQNPRAFLLSPTAGYVIAQLTYSSVVNGKPEAGRVLTTTVFSRDHGRWMAHLHTEMDMQPEPKSDAANPKTARKAKDAQ